MYLKNLKYQRFFYKPGFATPPPKTLDFYKMTSGLDHANVGVNESYIEDFRQLSLQQTLDL